ncbi:MAG: efflux RND transporter permease subunit, partial [Hyphomicrobiales bacterium]
KPKKTPEEARAAFDKPLFRAYRTFIGLTVRAKYPVAAAMIGTIVASFYLLSAVPQQFFPESDRNQYLVYVDLPSGATTEATQETMSRFTSWLGDETANPKVTASVAYVGYGGPRFFASLAPRDSASNIGFALVTVETGEDVSGMIDRTRHYFADNHPEAYARVKKFFLGNTEPGLVEVRLRGREPDRVAAYGRQVEQAFRDIPGTIGIYQNWGNRVTNVIVEIDQTRARRAQVTSREIADSLNGYFGGEAVSVYREGDQTIPILIRAKRAERTDMDRLRSIEVYSQALGSGVLLSEVAEFRAINQYSKIARYNLKRAVTVEAKHSWMQAGELLQAVQPALDRIAKTLPAGYVIEIGGEPHAAAKGQNALFEFVPHCLAAMILLLVWQFNSFAKPAIVFLSIPLSFLGAAVGLLATGSFLGFMATLGFLSLAGIIINNAIVLIDETQVQIDQGKHPFDAVVEASVSRLQPVMMTTATTILGLFTLMIPPSPLFFAMAVVIAAGLSVGTLLTLVAVPVLYAIFFRVSKPSAETGEHNAAQAGEAPAAAEPAFAAALAE